MEYNNERYAVLENGKIEPLYYGGSNQPRNFYQDDDGKWYLDHDEFDGNCFVRRHDEIIAFGTTTEEMTKEEEIDAIIEKRFSVSRSREERFILKVTNAVFPLHDFYNDVIRLEADGIYSRNEADKAIKDLYLIALHTMSEEEYEEMKKEELKK